MNESKPKYDVIERFKTFRNSYDKILFLFSGFFWICSSLWDVYKFQRYWLDYAMEFYSSFFFFQYDDFFNKSRIITIRNI